MKVVLCNCPPDVAPGIAHALIDRRLAACVNLVGPVRSVYWWDGAVCDEPEMTLIIKVRGQGIAAMREALIELHPYAVPEIIVLPVEVALSHFPYVEWVRSMRPD